MTVFCRNCNKSLVFHERNSAHCPIGEPTMQMWQESTFNAEFSKNQFIKMLEEAYNAGFEAGLAKASPVEGKQTPTVEKTPENEPLQPHTPPESIALESSIVLETSDCPPPLAQEKDPKTLPPEPLESDQKPQGEPPSA